MKKIIALITLMSVLVLSLAGCQGATDQETQSEPQPQAQESETNTESKDSQGERNLDGLNITFWHSMGGVNGEAVTYLVDKFKLVFKENIEQYPQFLTAIDQLHDTSAESAGALLSV